MTETARDRSASLPRPGRRGKTLRRIAPAIGLFFLAPLFGEYLLGNQKFSELALLPILATLYGAGALLLREIARRFGRGSVAMLTLGVAYALFEEGLVDQMLFNHSYFAGQAESSDTVITALGVDAWLTIIVVAMHAVWSIYIPITIVEALVPHRRTTPWLGAIGTAVTAVVFVAGSAVLCRMVYTETKFIASVPQLTGTAVVIAGLIAAAFLVRDPVAAADRGAAPRPWIAGASSLVASSLFMLTESLPGWTEVAGCLFLLAAFSALVRRWSRGTGWGPVHRLALVGGAVGTYAWLGMVMEPESGPRTVLDHVGGGMIAIAALGLLVLAGRRLSSWDRHQAREHTVTTP
ncbi:hypothetical protein QLQ12_23505 [Actinoplanes sp. NEAU-A12]|uniref:DUF998 domain-containing protein n=1 Tax=Actinoplanes sandaracinus TaxID=3045177 RepID=A0ABT6WPA6_9ACTN|nr:hypothetical protein [Actinoplanes sandaracinus]MDI6101591.1 hypothetical protein [Actinoplanes sandaracinus]